MCIARIARVLLLLTALHASTIDKTNISFSKVLQTGSNLSRKVHLVYVARQEDSRYIQDGHFIFLTCWQKQLPAEYRKRGSSEQQRVWWQLYSCFPSSLDHVKVPNWIPSQPHYGNFWPLRTENICYYCNRSHPR